MYIVVLFKIVCTIQVPKTVLFYLFSNHNFFQDKTNYKDDFGDSDNEAEPDAYLERVKAEAQERESEDNSDESTDEDFNPNQVESDVAEEYDSNPTTTSDEESGSGKTT